MRRQYAGGAKPAYLTAALGGTTGDLTITCNDLSNWPDGSVGPFYVVVDRGLAAEEKILCSSRSGNVLTVYSVGLVNGRGADGTTVIAHNSNAEVEHVFTATDADEANNHVNDSTNNVHPQYLLAVNSPSTLVDAKGDLLAGTAADTLARVAVGANGYILSADSTAAAGVSWIEPYDSPTGGSADRVFFENDITVTANYTITASKNAGSFGPITINSGVTVTVPSGSVWTVV